MSHTVKSTCCYCGVGCGVLIESGAGRITGVRGDPDHPANNGRLCTKGASLHLTVDRTARLMQPTRQDRATGQRREIGWDAALDEAAERFAAIIRAHGPDAVAFYVSGQLLTEDYYVFNKLAKGLVGSNNIDTNSRLCMSSAVAGYKQTLGVDAPPCSYEDIGLADVMLITGANPAVAHPIVFRRIEEARQANPELKIIVVDPRRSETAQIADLHLALRPGTDIALYNAMLHVLIEEGLIDAGYIAAHTEGFAELAAIVSEFTPARAAEICGLAAADIITAARHFGRSRAALSLWCQGLNQSAHGTHNNAALIHLHLATGQIGRPGAGPFSLTGQPNAMGGREVGGLANLLSAHRDLANPAHRAEVAQLWGIADVPARPGKTAVELFEAVGRGEIKAVWIACTNPAHSLPDQAAVRAALAGAEYVVLQEAYARTDTAAFADLLLPASTWGEKEGTVTNSERRISRVRAAVAAPGAARPDWQIASDFARRLGAHLGRAEAARLFPYQSPEEIFNEHRESTRGRDLDITGLSYARLEAQGPQQWPFPEGASTGAARLYGDGRFPTASGRARFVAVSHAATADIPGASRPLSLISGRMRDHWHGMSRTGTVPRLYNLEDEPWLAMHPAEMSRRRLADGDVVRISNERGEARLRVRPDAGLRQEAVWLPMHWGSQFMNSPGANALTPPQCDPYSRQPELKHAAVQVERLDLPYPVTVLRLCTSQAEAVLLQQEARDLLAGLPYANLSLFGGKQPLVVFRARLEAAPSPEVLSRIDRMFGLADQCQAIHYADARRAIDKKALVSDGRLVVVRLAGEAKAEAWLKQAMAEDELDTALFRLALAPVATAPSGRAPRQIVCKCADVCARQIADELAGGAALAGLQDKLKCGTFCGGCLPEIRRLAANAGSTTQLNAEKLPE